VAECKVAHHNIATICMSAPNKITFFRPYYYINLPDNNPDAAAQIKNDEKIIDS